MVEVSVVCAALLGTVLGGLLVSPWLLGLPVVATTSLQLAQLIGPQAGLLGVSLALQLNRKDAQ